MSNPNHPPSEPSRIIQYPKPGAHAGEAVPDLAIASTLTITAADLTAGMMAADELDSAQIPKRENLCGTWFRQGDLGFIFGPRGLGHGSRHASRLAHWAYPPGHERPRRGRGRSA